MDKKTKELKKALNEYKEGTRADVVRPKIVCYVSGGVLSDVRVSHAIEHAKVVIVDKDNLRAAGMSVSEVDEVWRKAKDGTTVVW